jgi:hypothetical protein
MKNFKILDVQLHNDWISDVYITKSFASEQEAKAWCDENTKVTYDEFPKGSNSYSKSGIEYRFIGEG